MATQFFIAGEGFFWELATLVTVMLLGHWLEMASVAKAEDALGALSALLPDMAEKLEDGIPQRVAVRQLKAGDLVLVRPGARMPADGMVVEGGSLVDEALITGESMPVAKSRDSEVVAGTSNQDGALTVKVTKVGEETALAGIMQLVAEAQRSKSHVQVLADKAAFGLTVVAIVTAIVTFVVWFVLKGAGFALERSVTVLIIACPHALGLAIPLVVSISTALLARSGVLVRRRSALETARSLDWVLFDKTGTLTRGEHGVTDVWPAEGSTEEDVVRLAATVEQTSEHAIGNAIVRSARKRQLRLGKASHFTALPGLGVQATVPGAGTLVVAGGRFVRENGLVVPDGITKAAERAGAEGKTVVYLAADKQIVGALGLADIVRPQSRQAIDALRRMGIRTAMITGDSREVAADVARQLGIDQYFAEVRPEDKVAKVVSLQKGGANVAMVGDGINDAPALAQADTGIAIGAGIDVAIKSADIILVKSDPWDVVKLIILSKRTYSKMVQNLLWATGYNVVAIPLAAGALYAAGIVLAPAVGAALMSVSTVVVAVNAQLLRRARAGSGG